MQGDYKRHSGRADPAPTGDAHNIRKEVYNPEVHHRRSIRLPEYDYSADGLYFVTICTEGQKCLFGKIEDERMMLNDAGKTVERHYLQLEKRYPYIVCREYVVMPNHFHCILQIDAAGSEEADGSHPRQSTLEQIVGYFKYRTTQDINLPFRLWQRNYYEHIIRNALAYDEISNYINNNPALWKKDSLFK